MSLFEEGLEQVVLIGLSFSFRSGVYDEEYLTYLRALLQSMTDHGLLAYVVSKYS